MLTRRWKIRGLARLTAGSGSASRPRRMGAYSRVVRRLPTFRDLHTWYRTLARVTKWIVGVSAGVLAVIGLATLIIDNWPHDPRDHRYSFLRSIDVGIELSTLTANLPGPTRIITHGPFTSYIFEDKYYFLDAIAGPVGSEPVERASKTRIIAYGVTPRRGDFRPSIAVPVRANANGLSQRDIRLGDSHFDAFGEATAAAGWTALGVSQYGYAERHYYGHPLDDRQYVFALDDRGLGLDPNAKNLLASSLRSWTARERSIADLWDSSDDVDQQLMRDVNTRPESLAFRKAVQPNSYWVLEPTAHFESISLAARWSPGDYEDLFRKYGSYPGLAEQEYQKIQPLAANTPVDSFIRALGEPQIRKDLGPWKEYGFVHPWYLVQAIVDPQDVVQMYAVTSRSTRFKPTFQLGTRQSVTLGKFKFSDFKAPVGIFNWIGANRHSYAEAFYLGLPGNYQHYILAVNDAGTMPDDELEQLLDSDLGFRKVLGIFVPGQPLFGEGRDITDAASEPRLAAIRSVLKPNTFVVASPGSEFLSQYRDYVAAAEDISPFGLDLTDVRAVDH